MIIRVCISCSFISFYLQVIEVDYKSHWERQNKAHQFYSSFNFEENDNRNEMDKCAILIFGDELFNTYITDTDL